MLGFVVVQPLHRRVLPSGVLRQDATRSCKGGVNATPKTKNIVFGVQAEKKEVTTAGKFRVSAADLVSFAALPALSWALAATPVHAAALAPFLEVAPVFDFANAFVIPFWLLMLVAPRWKFTQDVLDSGLPFAVLGLIYLSFLVPYVLENPTAFNTLQVADIAKAFSDERAAALGWTHFLLLDLFAARYIMKDGLKRNVPFRHSILFTLFAGPIGVMSHFLTSYIVAFLRR